MEKSVKDKFLASMKDKDAPEVSQSDDEASDQSPTYDLACRLCEALGVSEDKADKVAEVLLDLQGG